MYKLPIEKSQSQHMRTSKTGKVFYAGKGTKEKVDPKGQLEELLDVAMENLKSTWERWKKDFSDEEGIENIDYMDNELKNSLFPGIEFALQNIKNGNITRGIKKVDDAVECTRGRCYYNALDYSKRTGADLAFGYIIDPKSIENVKDATKSGLRARVDTLLHVFNIVDGKVVDPTMGRDSTSIVTYEIVPKEVWNKFSYKEKDPDQNAKELDYWMQDKMKNYEKNIDILLKE